MRTTIIRLLGLIIIVLLAACQPQTAVKSGDSSQVDSSFYYVQEDIDDPFIDTVFQDPDQPVTLQKELYPPPPQKEFYKQVEGFRVQIFAGLDAINADAAYTDAGRLVSDSVYKFEEKGLIKVQVGDFQFRPQADNTRDLMRSNGFTGAWVVQRVINIPIDTAGTQIGQPPPPAEPAAAAAVQKTGASGRYRIQIMASSSEDRARTAAGEIKSQLGYDAFYEKSGSLYKVFVGYFNDEISARQVLDELRGKGYPDAWLVY